MLFLSFAEGVATQLLLTSMLIWDVAGALSATRDAESLCEFEQPWPGLLVNIGAGGTVGDSSVPGMVLPFGVSLQV